MVIDLSKRKWTELRNVPVVAPCYLGIDPSLTRTGFALLAHGKLLTDSLRPPPKLVGMRRLVWFYDWMEALLHTARPAGVAIEGYAFGARAQHHALGELGGVFRLALARYTAPVLVVPPTVLKKFATGAGNGEKSEVSKELFKRFGIDVCSNDEVDAAGLAVIAACMYHGNAHLTKAQTATLSKIIGLK